MPRTGMKTIKVMRSIFQLTKPVKKQFFDLIFGMAQLGTDLAKQTHVS